MLDWGYLLFIAVILYLLIVNAVNWYFYQQLIKAIFDLEIRITLLQRALDVN